MARFFRKSFLRGWNMKSKIIIFLSYAAMMTLFIAGLSFYVIVFRLSEEHKIRPIANDSYTVFLGMGLAFTILGFGLNLSASILTLCFPKNETNLDRLRIIFGILGFFLGPIMPMIFSFKSKYSNVPHDQMRKGPDPTSNTTSYSDDVYL